MKQVEYKIQTEGFGGWAKIALLKYRERLALIRECSFDINQKEGEVSVAASQDNIRAMEKIVEIAPKYIKDLEVTHKESKTTLKSYDELEYDATFDPIIQELAFVILNGVKLGGMKGRN